MLSSPAITKDAELYKQLPDASDLLKAQQIYNSTKGKTECQHKSSHDTDIILTEFNFGS